ncbi:prepilin-type N-terminal cleavage/methylation domain-containing protein [Tunturiibacter gelidiferens]|uniref:type II secretion system protein n=1 Tax=Tunturiibacter gelidiferens TaxID=3069689 RepID=UPI003D9B7592
MSFRTLSVVEGEQSASLPHQSGCPILRSLTAKGGIDEATPGAAPVSSEQGFTLLELMIVMVVIGLLAAIAIPAYTSNIRNAKEAVLKEDLHTMRQAIDSYTVDKAKAPKLSTTSSRPAISSPCPLTPSPTAPTPGSPSRRTPTSASTRPKPASTTSTAEPSKPPPTAHPTTPGKTKGVILEFLKELFDPAK